MKRCYIYFIFILISTTDKAIGKAMKILRFHIVLLIIILPFKSFSQGFLLTPPTIKFDGNQLQIIYDIESDNKEDQFYVWVEMVKSNEEPIQMKSLSGDVGTNIKAGENKQINWIPENDAVFLDEEVFVEVKAEKYVKSFNKGGAMLMSALMPGLGQTKISNGKPWWLTGVAAYGAMTSGIVVYNSYLNTYDTYRLEENPSTRANLLAQSQQKKNISNVLIISSAALWAANILWVAITPNKYQPLQNLNLTLNRSTGPHQGTLLLALKLNF